MNVPQSERKHKFQTRRKFLKTSMLIALTFCPYHQSRAEHQKLQLPVPTGPFAVGTQIFHFVDESRAETNAPDPTTRRELMVQLWYPAAFDVQAPLAHYIPEYDLIVAGGTSSSAELGQYRSEMFRNLLTHAYLGASISRAKSRYPILIFSPGNGVPRSNYTVLFEELASHGYIIAAIDHPYSVAVVAFPDGRVVLQSSGNSSTYDAKIAVRTADILFVVNELEQLNAAPSGKFTGRLDLDRLAALGHSNGGVAAIEAVVRDSRFKAALNLDGGTTELSDSLKHGIERPFMLITKTMPITTPTEKQLASWGLSRQQYAAFMAIDREKRQAIYDQIKSPAYRVVIHGAKHMSFSDTPLLEKDNQGIVALRALRIAGDYALAFFNKYLGDKSTILMNGPSTDYVDVTFESYMPKPGLNVGRENQKDR